MGEEKRLKKVMKGLGVFIKKRKILILIAIVAVAGGFGFFRYRSIQAENVVKADHSVSTTILKKRDLTTSVRVTGTIASADKREVTTGLKDTEIKKISASVGDYVSKGDTIIVFDDADLEEAYEETQSEYELNSIKQNQTLSQAQDSVTDAQEDYDKGVTEQASLVSDALSDYNSARSKESDALLVYTEAQDDTEQAKTDYESLNKKKSKLKSAMESASKTNDEKQKALSQAKAAYETAEANIKYAPETDENYQTLKDAYTAAYAAYTTAETEAEAAKAVYEMAQKEYSAIEEAKTAYEEAQKAEESARVAYEEASDNTDAKSSQYSKALQTQSDTNEKNEKNIEESKENLSITSEEVSSNLNSQKKQVIKAEEKLGECVITSPISGYITEINVEEGDVYNGSDTLFVVQDMDNFVVDATVDEYDIASLAKDQQAVIKTDATGDEELKGVLSYVALTPDESGSSMGSSSSVSNYTIQITLTDENENLRIGMTAKTSIILESAEDVFAIAYDCVETDKDGNSYITVMEESALDNGNTTDDNSEKSAEGMKKINVEVGIESDYYVEIKSDELQEGMKVIAPQTVSASGTDSDSVKDGFSMGGLMGGGMPDGGGRPGGNGNSGGNRGGGAPGGSR